MVRSLWKPSEVDGLQKGIAVGDVEHLEGGGTVTVNMDMWRGFPWARANSLDICHPRGTQFAGDVRRCMTAANGLKSLPCSGAKERVNRLPGMLWSVSKPLHDQTGGWPQGEDRGVREL